MKLAFPTTGTDLASLLDGRFGRAERFLIAKCKASELVAMTGPDNAGHAG